MRHFPENILVTFDLDSTLCDTTHRHHMIDRENGTDWHAYSAACVDDTPILGTVQLVRLLAANGVEVHALSARKDTALELTQEWFHRYEIPITRFWLDHSTVGDYDSKQDHVIHKVDRVHEIEQVTGKKVILHIDDWAGVAVAFEEAGIPCICVRTPIEIQNLTAEVEGLETLK